MPQRQAISAKPQNYGKPETRNPRLIRTIPMPPYLAKIAKEKIGVDFLINGELNLPEAEFDLGRDWLN